MMGINHGNADFRPSLYNYNVRIGQMGPEGVASKIDGHTRAARFSGPTISGMQVKTSKGKIAQFADPRVEGQGWQKGLGRPGYAIVGFHGVFTTEGYRDALKTVGILNLGAWIVKTSELP
jgi:hypothetical protein